MRNFKVVIIVLLKSLNSHMSFGKIDAADGMAKAMMAFCKAAASGDVHTGQINVNETCKARSPFCSIETAPTKRAIALSLEETPTTPVRQGHDQRSSQPARAIARK